MGFGLLLTGYLMTYLMWFSSYGAFPALIGCVVMLYALTKLVEYEPRFKYAFFSVACVGLTVLVLASISFCEIVSVELPGFFTSGAFGLGVRYLKIVFDLFFHITLVLAIMKISGDTGLENIRRSAAVDLAFYVVFFVSEITDAVTIEDVLVDQTVFIVTLVLWLVCLIMNGVMIFRCYMMICDEGDQEMKRKPSRFGFINRFYDELDQREERARQRDAEYRKDKYEKKVERRKRRKK